MNISAVKQTGVTVLLLVLAACGSDTTTSATTEPVAATTQAPATTQPPATTTTLARITTADLTSALGRLCGPSDAAPNSNGYGGFKCGIVVSLFDDGGMEVAYFPNLDTGTGDSALDALGELTGCWGPTDRSVMGETRALDGRVESANGRSSWTYHPDDGMSIVCNPA